MPDTTTDRELLMKAAKAAGIEYEWHHGCGDALHLTAPDATAIYWNPLRDDGDAFRLAVALHMTVRCYMGSTVAQIGTPGQPNAYQEVTNHADPAAATRRAITRAAAEVQRAREAG